MIGFRTSPVYTKDRKSWHFFPACHAALCLIIRRSVALAYPVGWILCSALLLIRYRRSPLIRGPEAARKTRG